MSSGVRLAAWIAAMRALLRPAGGDQAEGGRPHPDAARGDGDAARGRLAADVHHMGGTSRIEVGQCLAARVFCHRGRYHKHL
jgi:hypothetical protein